MDNCALSLTVRVLFNVGVNCCRAWGFVMRISYDEFMMNVCENGIKKKIFYGYPTKERQTI